MTGNATWARGIVMAIDLTTASAVEGSIKLIDSALTRAAEEAVYIPGVWTCRVCDFGLVSTVLYTQSGTFEPDIESMPTCPNDGSLLYRVTYKERLKSYAEELEKRQAAQPVWSKEKPTVAGWYWWRSPQRGDEVVYIFMAGGKNRKKLYVSYLGLGEAPPLLEHVSGEWAGPLPLPREA